MKRKRWIIKFVWRYKWTFVCGFFFITLMTLIDLIYPFLNGKIVNIAFYEKDMSSFLKLCLIYTGILVFNQFVVASINDLIVSHLMTGLVFDVRRALFRKILHLKSKNLYEMYSGDLISRMNNNAADFVNLVFWSGLWGYSNILHILFAVFFMFYYNVILGIFTIFLVPIIFYSSKYYKRKMQNINAKILEEQGKLSSYLFEIVKNLDEAKTLNACSRIIRKFLRKTTIINKMKVGSGRIEVTAERVASFIALVAELIIFSICAWFIVKGQMQLGIFVSAISYFNMAAKYYGVLNGKIVDIGKQYASIQRVVDILNMEEENYRKMINPVELQAGKIEFRNVKFGYTKEKKILNGLNLVIDPGSIVGIVGKSGIGKTTIANLLCNLYEVDDGEILIDGININQYNLQSLRQQIGIVHQEAVLYDGSLRYNLSFSNEKCNDETLIEAIKKAALYDFYLTLPNGLDTVLGAGGIGMSGGQKQRLSIARIIVKNPKILIFDEATASLDSLNEVFIRKVIEMMSGKSTIIIIAHRLSSIQNCDRIAVVENGVIKGFDSHQVLLHENEAYINLFREQCIARGEI